MELNQQEQEILDVFRELDPGTAVAATAIGHELQWSTVRLMPLLAVLVEKRLLRCATGADYPRTTHYWLAEDGK